MEKGVVMALLVCSTRSAEVDWMQAVIYLDQAFYEAILKPAVFGTTQVLQSIARLGYKDKMLLSNEDLIALEIELADLESRRILQHRQVAEFKRVIGAALADGYQLAVSGDMYPERLPRR
jgi:hypothetical protein